MIDVTKISTDELEGYDDLMVEVSLKTHDIARIAVAVWSEVLKELDTRGRVRLVSGTYDDIGNALVQRLR